MLVLGSVGYSILAYPQARSWITSILSSDGPSVDAPSGINGSIAVDRGAVACSIPFPDPQGNVLVQGVDGNVIQVPVKWNFRECNLKVGVFRILVPPGDYHVSSTGHPLTLLPINEINLANLPLNIIVKPHMLIQTRIGINYGI